MKTRKLFLAFAFIMAVSFASAQNAKTTTTPAQKRATTGAAYVDKNNDGICDNYENGTNKGNGKGQGLRRGNGNGKKHKHGNCNGCGNGQNKNGQRKGQGKNFVDKNNDGVCDQQETVK